MSLIEQLGGYEAALKIFDNRPNGAEFWHLMGSYIKDFDLEAKTGLIKFNDNPTADWDNGGVEPWFMVKLSDIRLALDEYKKYETAGCNEVKMDNHEIIEELGGYSIARKIWDEKPAGAEFYYAGIEVYYRDSGDFIQCWNSIDWVNTVWTTAHFRTNQNSLIKLTELYKALAAHRPQKDSVVKKFQVRDLVVLTNDVSDKLYTVSKIVNINLERYALEGVTWIVNSFEIRLATKAEQEAGHRLSLVEKSSSSYPHTPEPLTNRISANMIVSDTMSTLMLEMQALKNFISLMAVPKYNLKYDELCWNNEERKFGNEYVQNLWIVYLEAWIASQAIASARNVLVSSENGIGKTESEGQENPYVGAVECPHPFLERGLCVNDYQPCLRCGDYVKAGSPPLTEVATFEELNCELQNTKELLTAARAGQPLGPIIGAQTLHQQGKLLEELTQENQELIKANIDVAKLNADYLFEKIELGNKIEEALSVINDERHGTDPFSEVAPVLRKILTMNDNTDNP